MKDYNYYNENLEELVRLDNETVFSLNDGRPLFDNDFDFTEFWNGPVF